MLKIVKSHHYIITVLVTVSVTVLLCGFMALSTYVSYKTRHDARRASHSSSSPAYQMPVHSDKDKHVIPPVTPDVHIPPIENGLVPVVTSLPTREPVVFLGIDDGQHKTADEVQMIKDNHIKASLYLANLFIKDDPDFFKAIQAEGSLIEDHTLSHDINMVTNMTYQQQKQEICGMADYEQKEYGRRPIFFRPPGGAYSTMMRKAAADCGMRAIVTWVAKANGGSMQYQVGDHLRPGDVVLMHFRPVFKQDMQAFIAAMNAQGLHTELLENWQ